MSSLTYLITGGNRGIGRTMLETLVQRPNTTVIATVRDVAAATSKSLLTHPTASGSKIIVVKLDSTSDTDALTAVEELTSKHGITSLDIVVANSGVSNYYGIAAETPMAAMREHFETNTFGPLKLFQAVWPLLQKSPKPIFLVISSCVGSITEQKDIPFPAAAYGGSKAAINYITVKIHHENPSLIAFVIHPGWVQTDMGNMGAKAMGLEQAPQTMRESVDGVLDKLDNATRESTSGTFQDYSTRVYGW